METNKTGSAEFFNWTIKYEPASGGGVEERGLKSYTDTTVPQSHARLDTPIVTWYYLDRKSSDHDIVLKIVSPGVRKERIKVRKEIEGNFMMLVIQYLSEDEKTVLWYKAFEFDNVDHERLKLYYRDGVLTASVDNVLSSRTVTELLLD